MNKRYFQHKTLVRSVRKLRLSGGRFTAAAEEVDQLLKRIEQGDQDPFHGMNVTNHGETRLANCIKYDLVGRARLITVLYGNIQILLYAGDHEDADAWLDSHKGKSFAVDGSGTLVEIDVSHVEKGGEEVRITPTPDVYLGTTLERLPYEDLEVIYERLTGVDILPLQKIKVGAEPEAIKRLTDKISNPEMRLPMYDVLSSLNAGDIDGARRRVGLISGKIRALDELSPEEMLHVRDGEAIKQIRIGSPEYQKYIETVIRSSTYHDWFLFMHPEQEVYVETDYSDSAKLSGVSGSGKTCIAVRRAIRLAQKSPAARVAVVTLNRSLAQLIESLVDHAIGDDQATRSRIHITSLFALCQDLLAELEPLSGRLYRDVTWKLNEHIDEVYREYYRLGSNYNLAAVMQSLHRQLIANNIDAESYIRDEFDWLRSVLPFNVRDTYLDIEREGRGMPLQRDQRELILAGLSGWEAKMADTGVIDYLGLTTAVSKHIDKLKPRYSSIIVDEVQDFGTTELAILRRLAERGANDMFFCGDLAQHILPKHLVFHDAGVDVIGRSFTLRRNYRNSREILKAAYDVLYSNLDETMLKQSELELLDPEYANRSSAKPVVCRAASIEEEIKAALILMKDSEANHTKQGNMEEHRGCIAIAGHSLYEISIFGDQNGIPVLDGTEGVRKGNLFLSDLEQTKGYEFDTMIIINCAADVLPPRGAPEAEAFRYGCQLYVAMTRAKNQLVLSYSGEPSHWLTAKGVDLSFYDWDAFVDLSEGTEIGAPGFLPENADADDDNIMSLTGRAFLFTPYALGLKADIQEKMAELVDGRSMLRGHNRVAWKNVGLLLDDLIYSRERGRTRHIFGPTADGEVREALERAKSGLRPVARRAVPRSTENAKERHVEEQAKPRVNQTPKEPKKAKLEEMSLKFLNLEPRTYVALHEMKARTIADLLELGYRGLRKSKNLGNGQIDEIRGALRKVGRHLPAGAVEKPRRQRPPGAGH